MMNNTGRPFGIIAAMQNELAELRAAVEDATEEKISGVTFVSGLLEGKRVVCAVCGEGKVSAAITAQTMILRYGVRGILNTGVAGGLAPHLRVCDVVLARETVQHDMDLTPLGHPAGLVFGLGRVTIPADPALLESLKAAAVECGINPYVGLVATGDQFVASEAQKERIRGVFGADACEMEGGAIAHVAYANGVPFAVLRAISDGGDGMEFEEFADIAIKNAVAVTKAFVRRV